MPSTKTSVTGVLTVPDGVQYKPYVALVGTAGASARVTPVTLTAPGTSTSADASADVTLASSVSPSIPIKVGQWLEFIDPAGTGGSVLAQVVGGATEGADFASGTDIILKLLEDLPASYTAIFPAFIDLCTDISQTRSVGVNSQSTFDHRRNATRQVARGDSDNSYTVGGLFSDYSAGQLTLEYAMNNSTDVYFERQRANPDSSTFTTRPPIEWISKGIVTEFAINPADGNATFSSGIAINGAINVLDPA
jgi:hypothetical protein